MKNSTYSDLIKAFEPYFNNASFTFQQWFDMWIESSSVNVLEVEWNPADTSSTAGLKIKQSNYSPLLGELRHHMISVAFIQADGAIFTQQYLVNNEAETQLTFNNTQGYKAILLDCLHQTYAKCRIDASSLNFLKGSINTIANGEIRLGVWLQVQEAVRDQRVRVEEHRNMLVESIAGES